MEALGMKTVVRFRHDTLMKGAIETYRNVTEIHYLYPPPLPGSRRVAFESDIHGTGITWDVDWIAEIEAISETEEAERF